MNDSSSTTTDVPGRNATERSNHIALVDPAEAEGQVADRYERIREQREGDLDEELALSKLWRMLGNDPELLETFWAHTDHMYNGGSLPFELKSKISLVVASVLDCEGCRFFHRSALERLGVDDDSIAALSELRFGDEVVSEEEYVVLVFAEKAARDPHGITDAEFQQLRELGLSERELLEVADTIAFHVYTGYLQAIAGIVYPGMSQEEWVEDVAEPDG